MQISGCMILKDEGEYLKFSIDSFIEAVDELIVVVDKGSTDDTLDILSSYPKVQLVRGDYRGNKLRQRQEYMKLAKGKWIFCPDGDEVYRKQDMEWLRRFAETDQEHWNVRFKFHQFWKDYIHVIRGDVWNTYLQRFFRRIDDVGYHVTHHTASLPDGRIFSTESDKKGKTVMESPVQVFHYSYCKDARSIRRKIAYYMKRDNPFCDTEAEIDKYVAMHPYFSGNFGHQRYGGGGLFCCGSVGQTEDLVELYNGEHPEGMKSHPMYETYYTHAKSMNKYMESHWQFHNHIDQLHHQGRFRETALACVGKTLEVGCANGDSMEFLKKFNPALELSGVEPTDWGYHNARWKYPYVKFYKDYAENLSLPTNSFDTVLLSEMIEHVPNPRPVLEEAFRVSRGRVVVTTPAKVHPDPDHKRVITVPEMRELLRPYSGSVSIHGLSFPGCGKESLVVDREEDIHFQIAVAA